MAEDISCGPEIDVPENNDNSKLQLEADAFLNAIAGGADEDQADEAAFFATNPDGIVVDDNGEVLESGANSKIKKGEKVEFIDDDDATSSVEKEMPPRNKSEVTEAGHDTTADEATATTDSTTLNEDSADEEDVGDESLVTFDDLGLSPEVLEAVKLAGYETPSPIQAKAIPALLQGANLLGTAQTGTGKTAAFSLPLLSRINFNGRETSMLVLTPTRELAIQVSDAIQQYAVKMPNVTVVPVYGGQDIVGADILRRPGQLIASLGAFDGQDELRPFQQGKDLLKIYLRYAQLFGYAYNRDGSV